MIPMFVKFRFVGESKTSLKPLMIRRTERARLFGGIARFLAVSFYFAQRVDWLVLRFVIGAGHNFAEQSHRNELYAADQQRNRKQHERAMLLHDGNVIDQLLEQYIAAKQRTRTCARQTQQAEELQRPG